MYVYNTCSLISIHLLMYILLCTHSNVYNSQDYSHNKTMQYNNIQCNTNAKNQVGWKARTFVSRSYQIKDNTVYYKLYFGMIWHISYMDSGSYQTSPSSLSSHIYLSNDT